MNRRTWARLMLQSSILAALWMATYLAVTGLINDGHPTPAAIIASAAAAITVAAVITLDARRILAARRAHRLAREDDARSRARAEAALAQRHVRP